MPDQTDAEATGTSAGSARRYALVTGAGSGVGRETALALAADGWQVGLVGRRQDALEETAGLAAGRREAMAVMPADVSEPQAVDALFEAVGQRFGRLDLLFNNAGVNASASPDELSLEDWYRVVSINLSGSFLMARAAFRMMRHQQPQGGRIINNGSVSAQSPRPNSIAYTATKHAVTGLTKSLSLDGRKHNIACGQVDIGNALTPMAARMQKGVPQANGTVAVEPVMDVANVARTVAFMASLPPDANVPFVTVMATQMPLIGRG